ncbi:TIM-barrel domain-containing protein [Mucilaginibacter sp. E4BP6]|uniref:glycoside hydrolase family 31 protein n=1 Tax=Mucilaginibacter sp. E4BP6 TaxID=2723089 RepID=UPI0015CCBB01|nr:TIM-barrel domain-containing protein [Mucilaginibacter sp. E4BP6]NYE64626.1 alpha-glucosidase [Mucilaginibacter sp. E4BP6]
MKNKKGQLILLLVAVIQATTIFTANAQITKIPHGILVKIGGQQVGLLAVKDAAFCLSLNDSIAPSAIKSVFIDESNKAITPYTVISAPPFYGIKTSYGKLMINTDTRVWLLYDAEGRSLIRDGAYSSTGTSIQITHNAGGLLYGSGNRSSKDLEKNQSSSAVGNGVVGIPYLWNTVGYSAFGVSANDNNPATWNRANKKTALTWTFPGKAANLYLWPAKTIYDGASGYVKLTGRPKLPPRWAFGYLQSQWGWADSAYIANVLTKFRTHKLPVDAFIFDFEWYTTLPDYSVKKEGLAGFSDFTFNPKLFPHPAKQIAELKSQGVKFIGIRKPRLGNAAALDTTRKNGWLISPNTDSRDLNFSNAALRKWFEEKTKPLLNAGVDAWWDDEGESYYTCYYWWNTAQRDLLASARPNYRHFTINRAFSPGDQRFGYCTWSGDIPSTWSSLADVPKDLLNFSLAGMYYSACDIGGFQGTPTKEMLVRWFQAGVFLPIMRSHSNIGTTARFPFLWGDDGEAAMRKALDLKYQLLPYIYSLGHEAYNTGAPIMRPLVMEFPADTAAANITDEWLVGKGLLAAPILNAGGKRKIYFPADTWYDYHTGDVIQGPRTISVDKALDEIPLYVRAGTILPVGPVIQYSEQISNSPLEIHIYPGKNGSFKMVEDDGVSYNYTKGNTRTTAYYWNDKTKTLTWTVTGSYSGKNTYKTIKAVLGKKEKVIAIGQKGSLVFK